MPDMALGNMVIVVASIMANSTMVKVPMTRALMAGVAVAGMAVTGVTRASPDINTECKEVSRARRVRSSPPRPGPINFAHVYRELMRCGSCPISRPK